MFAKAKQKRKRNHVLDEAFYGFTKYHEFGKVGCSPHTMEVRAVYEVVLADIQKHAGQALADTGIAERLNLSMPADSRKRN